MTVKRLDDIATEWNGGTPMPGISAALGEASALLSQGDVSGARSLLSSLATELPRAARSRADGGFGDPPGFGRSHGCGRDPPPPG
jgi:hypothetical protein